MTVNLASVNAALSEINAAVPIALTAYSVLKTIWTSQNPSKTEQDFIDFLGTVSQLNIDEASAVLASHGYVLGSDGSWTKPGPISSSGGG